MAIFGLFAPTAIHAQNLIWIHDDMVKPSHFSEYTKIAKEFSDACKKHNVQNGDYSMIRLSNGTYRWISRIPNLAALDNNPFAVLDEKVGKDKMADLHARFDKCYDKHNSYVVVHSKDMSYAAQNPDESLRYLKMHYMYVTPSQAKAVAEKIKALKAYYTKKGSKEYFDIYHSGLGCPEEFYVAVIWSKDESSYIKESDENEKLLGEDGKKIFDELFANVDRYEAISAWEMTDLGYSAKEELSAQVKK